MITETASMPRGAEAAPGEPILAVEQVTKTYGEGHTAVTAVHEATRSTAAARFTAIRSKYVFILLVFSQGPLGRETLHVAARFAVAQNRRFGRIPASGLAVSPRPSHSLPG